MQELPRFPPSGERDREAVMEWTLAVLDEYYAEHYHDDVLREAEEEARRRKLPAPEYVFALRAARRGDVTYLRKLLHPEIAEFIQPLPRGERSKLDPGERSKLDPWEYVRDTAKLIRKIWLSHFPRKRFKGGAELAEEIAAAYCRVRLSVVAWKQGGKTTGWTPEQRQRYAKPRKATTARGAPARRAAPIRRRPHDSSSGSLNE
jgi:hypothetical protein